jgi:predicted oxidoreductase
MKTVNDFTISFKFTVIVSDGTADVVDVIYVNILTWSMGCVGVGEVAKGEQ